MKREAATVYYKLRKKDDCEETKARKKFIF